MTKDAAASGTPTVTALFETEERRASKRRELIINVSGDLHERIIAICVARGVPVNEAVSRILEAAFPASGETPVL